MSDTVQGEVIAPLPFDLEGDSETVRVRLPKRAFEKPVTLTFHFEPGGDHRRMEVKPPKRADGNGIMTAIRSMRWPKHAERAQVALFYDGYEIDDRKVGRWPEAATQRFAINAFFDPDHDQLRHFLTGHGVRKKRKSKGRSPQETFEIGAMRLLNLLGVPAVWYGIGSADQRPDSAALVETVEGRMVVLLVECTIEKPNEKFSALTNRASKLRMFLGGTEILPVLFLQAPATPAEAKQAHDASISLIDGNRIGHLLSLLDSEVAPSRVVEIMRSFQSWPLMG